MRYLFSVFGTTLILIAAQVTTAQHAPFEKYRFEDGGYTLVGVFEHHSDHPVQKKVGEFYTDDIPVLNSIKKAWNFPKPQKMYACGYHYYIVLMRNGSKVDDVSINLECDQLVTDEGSHVFKAELLTSIAPRLKPLFARNDTFATVGAARKYWMDSKKDPNFVYAYPPRWLDYEGRFRFRTQCPKTDRDCYMSGRDSELVASVRQQISAAYPGEKFDLRANGGMSTGEAWLEITCNKLLEAKFVLFDRWDKTGFGKWEPLELELYSYWKRKAAAPSSSN